MTPSTMVCIASGPSLTRSDCLLAVKSEYPIIAVNTSWRLVPECQYLFAADFAWWEKHHSSVGISAELWTVSARAHTRYGLNLFMPGDDGSFNSGQRAIQLAEYLGARRIILLGYECSLENGKHWHGDHPDKMHNPTHQEVERWHREFAALNKSFPDVEIINCSRRTALTCFQKNIPESLFHA
ncbi:hypothetical protein [Serratia sp. BIGb0163]|uniref:hypothetical protein n=1 Tax=Serratia sp. BIGb0163 TaxID=2940613 RepID=UPI002168402D|nr:hypothetical protein [Serratia sp. BIGb0163]MCS4265006.1 hypothetical protein [Serratia sp. BIGb0163]